MYLFRLQLLYLIDSVTWLNTEFYGFDLISLWNLFKPNLRGDTVAADMPFSLCLVHKWRSQFGKHKFHLSEKYGNPTDFEIHHRIHAQKANFQIPLDLFTLLTNNNQKPNYSKLFRSFIEHVFTDWISAP